MGRRTEVTIETSRRLIVRHITGRATEGWCDRCLRQVTLITPDEAAALLNISSRTIYRGIENGRLHFVESLNGLLVCAASLPVNDGAVGTELLTIR